MFGSLLPREGVKDPRARLAAVYAKLGEYRYLQVYLGAGGYRPHAAAWTRDQKR